MYLVLSKQDICLLSKRLFSSSDLLSVFSHFRTPIHCTLNNTEILHAQFQFDPFYALPKLQS